MIDESTCLTDDFDLSNIENRLADMNKIDLIHYVKAVAGFIHKRTFKGAPPENAIFMKPLVLVLFRVTFVLSATRCDLVSIRNDLFSMISYHYPPLLSTIMRIVSKYVEGKGYFLTIC